MYGLPQAGKIANDQLVKFLRPHGYEECNITPGLWKHATRDITFCLVVDDFGIKYTDEDVLNHLLTAMIRASTTRQTRKCPTQHDVPQYSAKIQYTDDDDTTPALDAKDKK
mmetsp:Transcript_37439/g.52808  ORF Transcript_37439/g.52808 Transcript_37439/m.52808 type:complete len:111 (+) Transcript_37439:250-582(+)